MEIQRITNDYWQDNTFTFVKITYSTDIVRVPRRGFADPGRKRSPDCAQIHVSESGMLASDSVFD